ncbi:hypothetical protein CTAYLR_001735 [Chrysophaeum taylorii]|uniref:Alpha-1,3-glucosyltransferase n=1 Tax=Chrysophaeum taylorii TaxID=2483200 RepID=A0AAD7UGK4_9STRA|nr:hypothetical protein CTAYLR_001735 [Chrysophaeum taylorii]
MSKAHKALASRALLKQQGKRLHRFDSDFQRGGGVGEHGTAASRTLVRRALEGPPLPAAMQRFDSADYFSCRESAAESDENWVWWVVVGLVVRHGVSLHGYSGEATPPRFGDYEAHRHWMEVTINKEIKEWYTYDTEYWGLDYPPVMAYVEYALGLASRVFDPASVELDASRGYETLAHRRFMRFTVLLADTLFVGALGSPAALLSPAPILVDHGHFQYNCLPLGLSLWAAKLFSTDRPLAAAACFCLALNSKQTALYYAPAVFFEVLARARSAKAVAKVAVVALLSFAAIWAPLGDGVLAALRRCFPVERGVFEDKVANLWYAAQVVFRARDDLDATLILKLATIATGLAAFPVPVLRAIKRRNDFHGFLLSLHLSALAFFLFSYHVHEKAILVPLAPLLLLDDASVYAWYRDLFSLAAAVSISPLLFYENLALPYAATIAFFSLVISPRNKIVRSLLVALAPLHALPLLFPPPARYPDLYPALTSLFFALLFSFAFAILFFHELHHLFYFATPRRDTSRHLLNSKKKLL